MAKVPKKIEISVMDVKIMKGLVDIIVRHKRKLPLEMLNELKELEMKELK